MALGRSSSYANFQRLRDEHTGKSRMSYSQQRWLDIVDTLSEAAPMSSLVRPRAEQRLRVARPARTTFASRSVLASTLSAIVQARVTLSLRQEQV